MNDEISDWLASRADDTPEPMLRDGATVGDFIVVGFLGRGGSGEVYRAEHRLLRTPVALKVLHRGDDAGRRRFEHEAEILFKHPCPGLARFFAYGEADGRPYIATELLEERPLPTKERDIAVFIRQVAAAVGELHKFGYVHRDIKPSNILWRKVGSRVSRDRDCYVPVLIDLGLAKPISNGSSPNLNTLSVDGGKPVGVGTPGYAAPEQFTGGGVGVEADIHALGILANECFGGKPPKGWTLVIDKATSSIPAQRFATVNEFVNAIKCVSAARPATVKWLIAVSFIPVAVMVSISLCYFSCGAYRHGCSAEKFFRWMWDVAKGVFWFLPIPFGLLFRVLWIRNLTIGLGACLCFYLCISPWISNGIQTLFDNAGNILMAIWVFSMVTVSVMLLIPSVAKWYKREIS